MKFFGIMFCLFLPALLGGQALARTESATLMNKALANGLIRCYNSNYMKDGKSDEIKATKVYSVESLIVGENKTNPNNSTGGFKDGILKVPSKLGNTLEDDDVSCYQLFVGWDGGWGTGKIVGLLGENSQLRGDSLLNSLGYVETTAGDDSICVRYKYAVKGNTDSQTNKICLPVKDGKLERVGYDRTSTRDESGYGFYLVGDHYSMTQVGFKLTKEECIDDEMGSLTYGEDMCSGLPTIINVKDGMTVGEFREAASNGLQKFDIQEYRIKGSKIEIYSTPKDVIIDQSDTSYKLWQIDDWSDGATRALGNITPYKSWNEVMFTESDKYDLYVAYLLGDNSVYNLYIMDDRCSNDKNASTKSIPVKGSDGVEWCEVAGSLDSEKKVNIFAIDGFRFLDVSAGPMGVIEAIRNLNVGELDLVTVNPSTGEVDPTVDDPGTAEKTCANSGGAGSLGWIVCPILKWLGDASESIYTEYVEPSLNISPKLFSQSEDEGTRSAWSTFQNIANILFIILFLVVIFSQLTGVGIDNYGIKKILPKLIIVAILVNLSYYLCLICVDLSNILGNGLKSMFDGLSTGGTPTLDIPESTLIGKEIVSTSLTAVAVLAALVGMLGAVWTNPAVLLSLLVAALGVAISIFFTFILLATREAAVVVLVVVSPVALICYALPNTKRIFDRWTKMFEGMLLVYPICGLLIGGGNYVSRLLLSSGFASGGFVAALTAMIVGIVPIFFIPTVLKNSFVALGNLGAKISGFGERIRGGATRGIQNSERYRDAQRRSQERQTRIRAGLDRDGNPTARGERMVRRAQGRLGRFFGADKRQAAYIAAARRNITAGEAAGASLSGALARTGIPNADALPDPSGELGSAFGAKTEGAYYGGQFLDAARRGDITGMNAAIEAMRASNMKAKDIAKIVRYATNNNYLNSLDDNTRSAWARDMAKKYGNDFMSTDFELSAWMRNGGVGSLGGYGTYASSLISSGGLGMDDIKPEDISKMSGDSLAGMASAGLIDQSMAQRVLATSPNLSADKKIMLGALANGAKVTDVNQFKNDAKAIMNSNFGGGSGTMTIGGVTVTQTMRNAWTASTPQEVNVVQNFQGGGRQYQPVDVQEVGMYADSRGNVYRIRRTQDGRHIDDAGFEVDLSRLHPR